MPVSSVNVILGPAKSGKTSRAIERYCAFLSDWQQDLSQPGGVWIGPTFSALSDVRDRLAQRSRGAWLNPHTVTFATLAEEMIPWGQRWVGAINNLEKRRILEHIIDRLLQKDRLKHFAGVARTPGFLRQVSAAIADLKRRDVWAEDFRRHARELRDHDFALIYAAYQEHLQSHGLYDAEGRFWAARDVLQNPSLQYSGEATILNHCGEGHRGDAKDYKNPPLAPPWGTREGEIKFGLVVLDGFADFTTAQHDLLRLLSTHCDELVLTLPYDHTTPQAPRDLLFDKPARTLKRLEGSFPHLQRELANDSHFQAAGLRSVERNLFREDIASVTTSTEGLSIVAANSVQGEIRQIALRIKTLLATGRAQPEEIAVIFPGVDDVASRVGEIFDDFGVPFHLEIFASLESTSLYRAISKLLRLQIEDWPFELLLEITGNRLLNLISVDASEDLAEADSWRAVEACIRRAQLPTGRTLLMAQLREWADLASPLTQEESHERIQLAHVATLALGVLGELERRLSRFPARATLPQWLALTEQVLAAFGLLVGENLSCWQALRRGLAAVSLRDQQFGEDHKEFSTEQFSALLDTIAAEVVVPRRADDVGQVRVRAAEAARTLSAKHVFVAGLSEQSYSSAERSGQLYRESELHRIEGGQGTVDLAQQQVGEAMLLFYDVVTRASESVTLSYAAFDDKGQALTPCPLLTELERSCEPVKIESTIVPAGEIIGAHLVPHSRSDWRLQAVATALDGEPRWLAGLTIQPTTRALARSILSNIAGVASRTDRGTFGPFEGILASDVARRVIAHRYSPEHLWSPSQLETYAACPYQFFASQILKLTPVDGMALRSDHLRRGNLLHQVLVAVHETRPESGTPYVDTELIERFTAALTSVIEKSPLTGLDEALREIERREISSWATAYADQEIKYRTRWLAFDEPLQPTHFEVRFGPKARGGGMSDAASTLVPFTLDLGSEKIKLTGQIDRVDMGRIHGVTVFTIIDYKSGQQVKLADKDMLAGRQLQLPIYALAAENLLFAEHQAVALATGYWSVKSGGFASGKEGLLEFRTASDKGLTDSKRWNELRGPLVKRIEEIVGGIRAAQFPVYNENQQCTQYCDFSKICRIAQIRSLEKVWISPEGPSPSQPDRHSIPEAPE